MDVSYRSSVEERVARGVKVLDQAIPNWDQRITLGNLDLHSTTSPSSC